MTWRRNKEASNAAFLDLTSDVCLHVKREEVISNARTNWELLRSQTKCLTGRSQAFGSESVSKLESDFVLTSVVKTELKTGGVKVPVLKDRKIKRTSSQESQNTSSSNTSSNDFFRLPPILVPIINKMEQKTNLSAAKENRISDSLTSIGPNVDSSMSSLLSSSDSEDCVSCLEEEMPLKIPEEREEKPPPPTLPKNELVVKPPSDTNSDISVKTINTSSSGNASVNTRFRRNIRNVKSATNLKALPSKPNVQSRAVTAKPKKVISPEVVPVNKDREQGSV